MKKMRELTETEVIVNRTEIIGPYTIVEVVNGKHKGALRGYGLSRRSKDDKKNSKIGYEIAFGRAKKALAINIHNAENKENKIGLRNNSFMAV